MCGVIPDSEEGKGVGKIVLDTAGEGWYGCGHDRRDDADST